MGRRYDSVPNCVVHYEGSAFVTRFIHLNEVCGNDTVKPLILNVAHIQHIQLGTKGKDVHVRMSDKSFFFVKESLNEVKTLIAEPPEVIADNLAKIRAM